MFALKRILSWYGQKARNIVNLMAMSSLGNLKFDNTALGKLPVDKLKTKQSRNVPGACFSLVEPTPVESPQLVAYSKEALELIGVSYDDTDEDFVKYFSGNKLFVGSNTAAHCYCGHQFGYFSGQLGDGAAIYLGEIINEKGERWEVQLKGAGQTPYSRNNDGRKVLRSSIREFLCSEAMYHLGIPSTRAGTCVTSDSRVVRDIFYDNSPIMERCTIVSRIAPTFLRFGSFEIFKPEDSQTGRSGPSVGRKDILEQMLEYTVSSFFPEIAAEYPEDKQRCYLEVYKEVVRRTAKLVASWQCVGFCHGVLNTDNMSVVGLTIDYGPFGFMDYFDPDYVCNNSDNKGRYSYKKQPEICKWNLMKFAEALQTVLPLDEMKMHLNEIYDIEFSTHYFGTMRRKIGITRRDNVDDEAFIQKLLWTMQKTACDFTNLFQILSTLQIKEDNSSIVISNITDQCQDVESLKKRINRNVDPQLEMILKLAQSHPGLVGQLGLDINELKEQATKNKEVMEFNGEEKKTNDHNLWSDWISEYKERLKLEIEDPNDTSQIEKFEEERKNSMQLINPKIILRNHLAQEAIQLAEEGDFSQVEQLLRQLKSPYSFVEQEEDRKSKDMCAAYSSAPLWAHDIRVT